MISGTAPVILCSYSRLLQNAAAIPIYNSRNFYALTAAKAKDGTMMTSTIVEILYALTAYDPADIVSQISTIVEILYALTAAKAKDGTMMTSTIVEILYALTAFNF